MTSDNNNCSSVPYCTCDIFHLFNQIEKDFILILDIRTKQEYDINHIKNAEYFHIPQNIPQNCTTQQLISHLNINTFKKQISSKLNITKNTTKNTTKNATKKPSIIVYAYGNKKTTNKEFMILHQLSTIFKLQPSQLQILQNPGFDIFQKHFPFLCTKYAQIKEKNIISNNYSSIMYELKNKKNKIAINIHSQSYIDSYFIQHSLNKEYPNSVITDILYIGNGNHAQNEELVFQNLKITHIVNATTTIANIFENHCKRNVKYLKVEIEDSETADILPHLENVVRFIDQALNENVSETESEMVDNDNKENIGNEKNRVLVHCEIGVSRSSTIVIAYLMYCKRVSLLKAYEFLVSKREIVRPNSCFLKALAEYEQILFKGEICTIQNVKSQIRQQYLQKMMGEM